MFSYQLGNPLHCTSSLLMLLLTAEQGEKSSQSFSQRLSKALRLRPGAVVLEPFLGLVGIEMLCATVLFDAIPSVYVLIVGCPSSFVGIGQLRRVIVFSLGL
jgi:hypothetical protein